MKNKSRFLLIIGVSVFLLFVNFSARDYNLYSKPIAKVVKINHKKSGAEKIRVKYLNSKKRATGISLKVSENKSYSNKNYYVPGNIVFVTKEAGGYELQPKNDQIWLFFFSITIFVSLFLPYASSIRSILPFFVNGSLLVLMVVVCSAYPSLSLSFASSIMTLFFIFISLFFIDGINQKFLSDFSVSIVTILISLSLIFFTIISTNEKGLFLQSISFLSRPVSEILYSQILLGVSAGVIETSTTISTYIFSEKEFSKEHLFRQEGVTNVAYKTISTMSVTLFISYAVMSVPSLVLYLENNNSINYSVSVNLSIAITETISSILAMLLTVPITIYFHAKFGLNKEIGRPNL